MMDLKISLFLSSNLWVRRMTIHIFKSLWYCIAHCRTIVLNLKCISICFSQWKQPLHDFLLFKDMNSICQLDGNFDNHFNYMCTIIFIAKIPLQFQIKPELHLPGPYPGLTGDQNSPHTLCLTRKETLVTASSKEILIGTTNSWILYQRRDIYSICRICWNVAAYWWNTPTLIFSHLYTWQINF